MPDLYGGGGAGGGERQFNPREVIAREVEARLHIIVLRELDKIVNEKIEALIKHEIKKQLEDILNKMKAIVS